MVAFDAAQNHSTASSSASVSTSAWGTDTTAPSAPVLYSVSAPAHNQVHLRWHPATDSGGSTGAMSYKVYRNGDGSGTPVVTVSTTSYTDTGVVANTAYTYSIRAVDSASNQSAASASAGVTTPWQVLVNDNFNRADSSTLGSAWTSLGPQTPGVSAWRAYCSGSCTSTAASSVSNFRGIWNPNIPTSSGSGGLMFWRDANGYFFVVTVSSSSVVTLSYVNNSGWNTLSSWTGGLSSVTIEAIPGASPSGNIKVWVDGTLRINHTDTDSGRAKTGSAGFRYDVTAPAAHLFDNIRLETY